MEVQSDFHLWLCVKQIETHLLEQSILQARSFINIMSKPIHPCCITSLPHKLLLINRARCEARTLPLVVVPFHSVNCFALILTDIC